MDATVDLKAVDSAIALLDGVDAKQHGDEILTPGEVAKMLRCTTRTVMRYGDLGKIRRICNRKDGTQTRYSRRSVLAFLEGRAVA